MACGHVEGRASVWVVLGGRNASLLRLIVGSPGPAALPGWGIFWSRFATITRSREAPVGRSAEAAASGGNGARGSRRLLTGSADAARRSDSTSHDRHDRRSGRRPQRIPRPRHRRRRRLPLARRRRTGRVHAPLDPGPDPVRGRAVGGLAERAGARRAPVLRLLRPRRPRPSARAAPGRRGRALPARAGPPPRRRRARGSPRPRRRRARLALGAHRDPRAALLARALPAPP